MDQQRLELAWTHLPRVAENLMLLDQPLDALAARRWRASVVRKCRRPCGGRRARGCRRCSGPACGRPCAACRRRAAERPSPEENDGDDPRCSSTRRTCSHRSPPVGDGRTRQARRRQRARRSAATLRQTLHRQQFRQDRLRQSQIHEQTHAARSTWIDEQFPQFLGDAFGADDADLRRHGADGGGGGRLDVQLEARGHAHGAQQAQLVLGEALGRVADGAQNARAQIVLAADVIDQPILQRDRRTCR